MLQIAPLWKQSLQIFSGKIARPATLQKLGSNKVLFAKGIETSLINRRTAVILAMTENTAAVGNVVENGVASETNQQQNNNNNNNNGTNLNGYKKPPKEIIDIVDIPPQPLLSFSPDRKKVLQVSKPSPLPPIFELARPELKLAGLRVDADQFSRSRMSHYTELLIVSFSENTMLPHTGHGVVGVC
eukprot:TRINITY_DN25252_c0_g1_i1.p2 TRINITY_DN25252_c0_g1~~TRINITY_DN25252_c0_g1_i1.p2  ORF type:complete len:199 (+),score=24.42 TRINITY_DN25252_c0_g1_i1:42-599(+)